MYLYMYSGPVNKFGLTVHSHWKGYTYAVSEAKARSNLTYQFKKEFGMAPNEKITLQGKVKLQPIIPPNVSVKPEIIGGDYQLTFDDILNR